MAIAIVYSNSAAASSSDVTNPSVSIEVSADTSMVVAYAGGNVAPSGVTLAGVAMTQAVTVSSSGGGAGIALFYTILPFLFVLLFLLFLL